MKKFLSFVLILLVLLSIAAGVSKILLMEQEARFFAAFGVTDSLLIAFGIFQVLGGLLLAVPRTRLVGAAIVAVTFIISAVLLLLAGSWGVAAVTIIAMLLLVLVGRPGTSGPARH